MDRVLIIGYGNPLRGDDGLGWSVAQALGSALTDARILTVHQLTPELAEDLSRADLAIFLDAAATGAPGKWRFREVSGEPNAQAFTHQVSPESLVSAARLLYGRAPRALLFTMAGELFDFHEGLSAAVSAALPAMVEAVLETAATST